MDGVSMGEFDYEEYKRRCEARQQENARHLAGLVRGVARGREAGAEDRPQASGQRDFYLNVFLLRSEPLEMAQGCFMADEFLGDFFIRKCMWSTPSSIRSTAASFKKFYKCMLGRGPWRRSPTTS